MRFSERVLGLTVICKKIRRRPGRDVSPGVPPPCSPRSVRWRFSTYRIACPHLRRWVSAYRRVDVPVRVVHAHPLAGAERRLHDLHRPFTPRWPVWVGQWLFVSERWKALTGQQRPVVKGRFGVAYTEP